MKQTIIIATSLAMDALVVTMAVFTTLKHTKLSHRLRIASVFGFFQFFMTVAGWLIGDRVSTFLSNIAHLISFFLLISIGIKMIYDSFKSDEAENVNPIASLSCLLSLAIATSLDALAVGLSYGLLNQEVLAPSLIIGIVAFLFTLAGTWIGPLIGILFGQRMALAGGVVLILIGIDIINT